MVTGVARTSFNTKTGKKTLSISAPFAGDECFINVTTTDETFKNTLGEYRDVKIGIEKPGAFSVLWDAATKAPSVAFANVGKVFGKKIGLLYSHDHKAQTMFLQQAVDLNKYSRVTARYGFHNQNVDAQYNWKIDSKNLFSPGYDFGSKAVTLGWTHALTSTDAVKIGFNTNSNDAALEWINTKSGLLRVAASMNLRDGKRSPSLVIEKAWKFTIDPPHEVFRVKP